jgi:hypothetical protein
MLAKGGRQLSGSPHCTAIWLLSHFETALTPRYDLVHLHYSSTPCALPSTASTGSGFGLKSSVSRVALGIHRCLCS